ncbi:MAG TPA: hypothetical protein VGA07_00235 [Anaerolineales bacterium]
MDTRIPSWSAAAPLASKAAVVPAPLATRRLIVLVSEADWDDPELPGRIWTLASSRGSAVSLLGLIPEAAREPQARRQLISMAAAIQDSRIPAGIQVEVGNDWVGQVRSVWQPGDLVVCTAAGLRQRSLSQLLSSSLQVPVHVLTDLRAAPDSRPGALRQLVSWGGALGIIGGFLWLQIALGQPPRDAGQTLLLALTVLAEVGLLWIWNSFSA